MVISRARSVLAAKKILSATLLSVASAARLAGLMLGVGLRQVLRTLVALLRVAQRNAVASYFRRSTGAIPRASRPQLFLARKDPNRLGV